MRTSNFFSIAALVICGMVCVNSVTADGTPTNSDQVTVNIKFQPIQSIVVNSDSKTVDLEYATKKDYRDGVSKTITNHLIVFSTGGFVVSVNAKDENFVRTGDGEISVSDVKLSAVNGTTTNPQFTSNNVTLSKAPTALITSNSGGNELKYSVTYDNTAGSGYKYINSYIHGDTESVYTAEVIYTIVTN
jgi:hypothetical protein